MKVATYNINNINKRLDNLLAWLAKAEPDVVSLQELKAEQEAFPVNALRTLGYEAVWQGERSWNGVAILARNQVPVVTRTSLPGNPEGHFSENRKLEDRQARYIEAAVQGVHRRVPLRSPCISVHARRWKVPLAFGKARHTDRRAGRRYLFCREECKQRDSNRDKDHNVLGTILPVQPVRHGLRRHDCHREPMGKA